MAFDNRKLLAPAAAFTMAVIVVSYTYSSINRARSEAVARRRQRVDEAKSKTAGHAKLESKDNGMS